MRVITEHVLLFRPVKLFVRYELLKGISTYTGDPAEWCGIVRECKSEKNREDNIIGQMNP